MKTKFILPLLLLCFLIQSPAVALGKHNYFDPALLSPEFISPPLPEGGDQLKAEADYIVQRQKAATPVEVQAAAAEAKVWPEMMSTASIPLTRDKYPKTFVLLTKVGDDCHATIDIFKSYWHVPRPFVVDPRIKSDQFPGNASYPSGHTACSRVWAEVLGQVAPDKRADFRMRAREIADHRIVAGVHWPHDLVGGEQLALIILGAVQSSEDYQSDLRAAKSEWAK